MMKVYDMATYDVCEPKDDSPAPAFTTARARETAYIPALGLHQTEVPRPTDAQRAREAALVRDILDRFGE